MSSNAIADNFLSYAVRRMQMSQNEIALCLDKLTEDQMLQRGGDYENSIANLLLHLEGNIRQWILHGIGDQPDVRRRDAEFALQPCITARDARLRFEAAIANARLIVGSVDAERLLVIIDPQPSGICRYATILEAIFRVVGHIEHHAGQIILLTKQLTAADLDLSIPRQR